MEEILIANLTLDTYYRNRTQPLIIPTGDYGARVIRVHITTQNNPVKVDVDSAVSIVATRNSDGESQAFSGRADDDGSVVVPVVQWMLETPQDDVECHVVITGTKYQYSTNSFLIQPQDKANPTEISEDDPRVDVVTEVLANENVRQAEESIRTQNENLRIDAENLRNIAEKQRLIDEEKRIENETQRISAENYRDTTFKNWSSEIALLPNMSDRISRNDKRITNLEQGLIPSPFVTDDSVAYIKDVPLNALPFAEISKMGGMTYKNGDTLKSAPVTEVESVGANLIPFPYADTTKTLNGITFTDNGDGSITINGTATSQSWFYISQNNIDLTFFEVGQTYSLSGGTDQVKIDILFQNVTWGGEKFTITDEMLNAPNIRVEIRIKDGTSVSNVTIYPMLNKGSTALPYAPYVRHALPIPEAIQALDGYGDGINANCYNYVDCEKKQFVKCSGKVDMGTISWNSAADRDKHFKYSYDLQGKIKVNYSSPGMIAENYRAAPWGSTTIGDLSMDGTGVIRVYVEASSAANPSGMLYYELATPIITDISDILPADNFIGVEGGGTITAANEYEYAVPTEITYQIKEATL